MASPRIAVVHLTTHRPDNPGFQQELDALNASIVRTLKKLKFAVDLIPASQWSFEAIEKVCSKARAIFIMGGEDIHPEFYGARGGYPGGGVHEAQGDRNQIRLVHWAAANGKPLLGICRGLQIINVAFNGTLVQHLTTSALHRGEHPDRGPFVRHPVRLTAHGVAMYGASNAVIDGEVVHSTHHQSVGRIGEHLVVTALSPDGVVEALSHVSAPVHGVQWHPEHPDSVAIPIERLLNFLLASTSSVPTK